MKVELIITKRKIVDIPDDMVAAYADAYFKKLGPEVYAVLLCDKLDFALKNEQPITHEQVDISNFAAEMTISLVILVEGLQEQVYELGNLETSAGEGYELYNYKEYSAASLSQILGNRTAVIRPTMAETKALCSPIVNVHGRHYAADIMPIVATTSIMTNNGNMIEPDEWFYYGDIRAKETWENLVNLLVTYEHDINGMPLTYYSRRLQHRNIGKLKHLFLDRCILDQEISEAIGVKYYQLPLETREELR